MRKTQQQGLGRPIISANVANQRVVAVGSRLYNSNKWKTFHDFLRDYLLGDLGADWIKVEHLKPLKERHQILRWYAQALADTKAIKAPSGAMINSPMTGAIQSFMNLAYNIYLIAHHGGQAMADLYLKRLRSTRSDDFTGALFETYAAAAFLKAGFQLAYEETERRSTSCVEFVATWPKTKESFSVEVKSRLHAPDQSAYSDGKDEVRRLRVGAKLIKALSKNADHARVVMIEINVPDKLTKADALEGWPSAALAQIRGNESALTTDGQLFPPAYVFVTNHSFHHDLNGTSGIMQAVADGFHIPDFGPDVQYRNYAAVLEARERHAPMMALIASMKTHHEIPATFDGELPSSLTTASQTPRFHFGRRYSIPNAEGAEYVGRFYNATVNSASGLFHGAYELDDGTHVISTSTLSADELAEYRKYPDTYFGEVRKPNGRAETFVDLCDWLFDSYKDTSREKLLESMVTAKDFEQLKGLGQRDLAITYCERMASALQTQSTGARVAGGNN